MEPIDSVKEVKSGENAPRVFPLPGTTYYNMLYDQVQTTVLYYLQDR